MNNSLKLEIQRDKKLLQESIELAEALHRLKENEDYKKIFEPYLNEYALDCLHISANINCVDQVKENALFKAKACGALWNYLDAIELKAEHAKLQLSEYKEEEDAINESGDDD